ncbi:MAG: ComEC family competence protein [Flammeovirgaceae bacterium]|nr:ComEC family competence protein [Flammeovirgaceae bacterium]
MFQWVPFAFVRIVIVFASGIIWGIYWPDSINQSLAIYLLIISLIAYLIFFILQRKQSIKITLGWIAIPVIFFSGYLNVLFNTESSDQDHFIHEKNEITFYRAVISKAALEKDKSWKQEAEVTTINVNGKWLERKGEVLLYFPKGEFQRPFSYGDELLIEGSPHELTPPANPGEFDYKRFLIFKNTYHQHFVRANEVMRMGYAPSSTVMKLAIQARDYAQQTLNRYVNGEREQAIASALVLGVTDGLDNELLNAYAATGAMHVLAVSGLHVGIIYWLLLLILKPLMKVKSGKWILAGISITVLWMYAFITGLSPSVLRAVTMFSFIALARPWDKSTNIYNTLAASAFCLLLYDPYLIMSVGFQLSYLAVLGIVYLQQPLYNIWEPKNWLLDKTWQITCVSIAAQISTCALGLLYFHQFPNYFLFSNLFVIPGSFIVLVAGIGVIAISFIPFLAMLIGLVLEWSIRILNMGVFAVEQLPYSLVENIYITTLQCWLLMGVFLFGILMIERRQFGYLPASFTLVAWFSVIQWIHFEEEINKSSITVYRVPGHSAFDLSKNGRTYFFSDTLLMNDEERVRFHIRPNRLIRGISSIQDGIRSPFYKELDGCSIIAWNGLRLLHIRSRHFEVPAGVTFDYVLVSNNALVAPESINTKQYILDSSNSLYLAEKFMALAKEQSLPCHSVMHQAYFKREL